MENAKATDFGWNVLVAGVNDHLLCGEGWHERTTDGRFGLVYRATGRRAEFFLDLAGGDVELVALLSASTSLCGGAMRGELLAEGKLLGAFTLDTENWVLRRFVFADATPGRHCFTWIVHNPFIPNEVLRNGDYREMGVYVGSVGPWTREPVGP